LFSTTIGLGSRFSFWKAEARVRAKISLPPPALLWTIRVMDFSG
jgi:hypothetical protein